MTGRILIVDSLPTNRIVLRVKLASAFYEVTQAVSGTAALDIIARDVPDLVIASADLPDMGPRAFCQKLRAMPSAARMPVILVHSDLSQAERLQSLESGADDVLTRPIDELVLLARLRSLLRARDAEAELALRDDTRRALGLGEEAATFTRAARVAFVPTENEDAIAELLPKLRTHLPDRLDIVPLQEALLIEGPTPDVFVITEHSTDPGEGLSLLSQLRASTKTRNSALIYVAAPHQRREAASALDMGASDLMASGIQPDELAVRLRKQIARKRMSDRLRSDMRDGIRAAVVDPLTGLYNRRYALPHLARIAQRAADRGRPYAILLADIDHFKRVNDNLGHNVGDQVLREVAQRLQNNLRAADMIARIGGEEFLVVMPDATADAARHTAERLCRMLEANPIALQDAQSVPITLSIGVCVADPHAQPHPEDLLVTADRALYAAKDQGRNTVVMADTVTVLPKPAPDNHAPGPAPVVRRNSLG
ncbi:MAG: diguanylate cyclase [Paracoccaceae bacterium]|nr:diguanylate cyclase [Paracoccaceae bacterium]